MAQSSRKTAGQQLVWKCRLDHPKKLAIMVKMHLTFLLPELRGEVLDNLSQYLDKLDSCEPQRKRPSNLFTWGLPASSASENEAHADEKRGVFGAPLSSEGIAECAQLVEYLAKQQNLEQEGLFRKSGSTWRQRNLIARLNTGVEVNLEDGLFSAHDVATVYKQFFRQLPEPLMTDAHFPVYEQISMLIDYENMSRSQRATARKKQLTALQLLMILLPPENRDMISSLFQLLNMVVRFEPKNKMDATNLGTVFGALLFCPKKLSRTDFQYCTKWTARLVTLMITHFDKLFKVPQELVLDVRRLYARKATQDISKTPGAASCSNEATVKLDESGEIDTAVSFADQAKSAADGITINTETELAALYAHVQQMPDSAHKRKLLKTIQKQNRENIGLVKEENMSPVLSSRRLKASIRKTFDRRTRSLSQRRSMDGLTLAASDTVSTSQEDAPYPLRSRLSLSSFKNGLSSLSSRLSLRSRDSSMESVYSTPEELEIAEDWSLYTPNASEISSFYTPRSIPCLTVPDESEINSWRSPLLASPSSFLPQRSPKRAPLASFGSFPDASGEPSSVLKAIDNLQESLDSFVFKLPSPANTVDKKRDESVEVISLQVNGMDINMDDLDVTLTPEK